MSAGSQIHFEMKYWKWIGWQAMNRRNKGVCLKLWFPQKLNMHMLFTFYLCKQQKSSISVFVLFSISISNFVFFGFCSFSLISGTRHVTSNVFANNFLIHSQKSLFIAVSRLYVFVFISLKPSTQFQCKLLMRTDVKIRCCVYSEKVHTINSFYGLCIQRLAIKQCEWVLRGRKQQQHRSQVKN